MGRQTSHALLPLLPHLQEARLVANRDAAQAAAAELRTERETLAAMVQQLEGEAQGLGQQLQEAQVGAGAACWATRRTACALAAGHAG